ncbi:glycosyltransferase family 4 protein [Bacteroidota bacterium]
MNILQIANKAIYPPDGGSLAILSLAKGYISNGHRVHILNMITQKHYNNEQIIEDKYKDSLNIVGVKINTRISIFKLIFNLLFSNKPYIAQRFISKKFKSKLVDLLANYEFDFIQIEGLYVLAYVRTIKNIFNGKIIYRPHNIEHLIWKRNYEESKSIIKKVYIKNMHKRIKKYEQNLLNNYDFVIPISQIDANIYKELGNIKPIKVIPFGIDVKRLEEELIVEKPTSVQSINYLGALDWIPNQKGLLWFINNCFPIVLQSYPNLTLNVAGRNTPHWFKNKLDKPNVKFYGEVENAYEFIQKHGPVIVPLFSGSGMRVKIIESMALKKAIVATSIAAEGINIEHYKNIIIANTELEFANAIISLLNNIDLQNEIGENAFKFVKTYYDFENIASETLNFIT